MATSGTVATTTFTTRQVVEHAFRRCKLTAQQITPEHVQTALDLLWLSLQTLNQRGLLLNTIQPAFVGLNAGNQKLLTPPGTLNIYSANLRSMTRPDGTASSASGTAANAFDGDLTTACTLLAVSGDITLTFTDATAVNMIGVLPASSGTWGFTLQTTNDGVTWTTAQTVSQAVTAGTWLWYEIDGVPSALGARIVADASTTLSVTELVVGNNVQEVPISPMDRDTYDWMSNKQQTGRPVQYWLDRQRTLPVMNLYPSPDASFCITYCVYLRLQRQLMDVGTMQQELELPNRWYLPIVMDLARHLAAEIKEVDVSLIGALDGQADKYLEQAWNGESDGAPSQLLPNIRIYQA